MADDRDPVQAGKNSASAVAEGSKSLCEEYYQTRWGPRRVDGTHAAWPAVMGRIAEELIIYLKPHRVLDAACGPGLLVKAFRERSVDAWGIDVSEQVIANAPADIRPYCRVAKPGDAMRERYDLIICINGTEQMSAGEAAFLRALTSATDNLLFASMPVPTDGPLRRKGRHTLEWLELFAGYGFAPNITYDASFASAHAMLLRRQPPVPRDVAHLFSECIDLRHAAAQVECGVNHRSTDDSDNPALPAGTTVAIELARYKERALILADQLAREREYLETLRSVHAYLVQEVQKLRELSHNGANAAASVDRDTLAARRRSEIPSHETSGGISQGEIWRVVQNQVELHTQINCLERRAAGIERSVQSLTGTVHGILQSRIWQALVSVGGVLLRVAGRGRGSIPKSGR